MQVCTCGFPHGKRLPGKLLENRKSAPKSENSQNTKYDSKIQSMKKVVQRGKHNRKIVKLNIFSTNAASLKSKIKSFRSELRRSNAGAFTLQETHYTKKGRVSIPDFIVFEAIRKGKIKGGTMIGVHKALNPHLITELNDPFELLVVEIKIGKREIRLISGYGPQESWSPEQREPFFLALEEEINKADLAGKSVIVEADFNSKLGTQFIPNDPHTQDKNGKLLANIIMRQRLCVANGLGVCEGVITRKRVTTQRTEESAISFVLVSEDLIDKVEAVIINEKREHVLTRITKTKDGSEYKESDHNIIETRLNLSWSKEEAPAEEAMFNLKNKECQMAFKKETSKSVLANIFEEESDLDKATEKFMK